MAAQVIQPSIVGRFKLEEINQAIDFMRRGQAHGRLVVALKE
jgi:D-arabinose 1-dehydrogenase-like Zn-dependent alcohol dehydrogenase